MDTGTLLAYKHTECQGVLMNQELEERRWEKGDEQRRGNTFTTFFTPKNLIAVTVVFWLILLQC